MQVQWVDLKAFVIARNLSIQWMQISNKYFLQAIDGQFKLECIIPVQDPANDDQLDFETNYKASGNVSFSDIDGIPFFRLKASRKGWSFWAVPIEITTSTIGGSLYCKDSANNNIPGLVCKIYNGNDEEITTPGLLNAHLATCVKTVLDFEPAFDYEMIGGELRINSNPGQDIRLWVVGAPDIPAQYGGSKEFASGVNLKFLDTSFEIDGRVTKYVTYNGQDHRGKLRVILKHPAGSTVNMQFVVHTYRL